MAELTIKGLGKRFDDGSRALAGLDATIRDGEFFVVLGPSGCGKSTLLRLIAGLETATEGSIACDGTPWSGPGVHLRAEDRRVGFVFQSYALWPHMTVAENVAFPAEAAGLKRPEREALAARCLETVGLTPHAARRPAELSGGQRQRVALARALASDARLVLMDEPLANLDPHLRAAMEEEFLRVHRVGGATTLYITHDQREAMGLADRIAVMMDGRFAQVAAPDDLYWRPASVAVARFVGRGALLPATRRGGLARLEGLGEVPLREGAPDGRPVPEGPCGLFVRPEEVSLGAPGPGFAPARVLRATYRGGLRELTLETPEGLTLEAIATGPVAAGETLGVALRSGWALPAPELAALAPDARDRVEA